jgi:hypothetical protein
MGAGDGASAGVSVPAGVASTAAAVGSAVGSVVFVGVADVPPTRTWSVPWGTAVATRADAVTSGRTGEADCDGAPPSRIAGNAAQENRERSPNPTSSRDNHQPSLRSFTPRQVHHRFRFDSVPAYLATGQLLVRSSWPVHPPADQVRRVKLSLPFYHGRARSANVDLFPRRIGRRQAMWYNGRVWSQ